jgi:hypothetical protein
MKNLLCITAISVLSTISFSMPASAQKGTGESTGIARQAVKPSLQTITGTIKDIKVGPCEQTTGRSAEGMHLIVQTQDSNIINLHLGPSSALDGAFRKLSVGQAITSEAFRTDRLPPDAYIAKSLKSGDTTLELRDDNLHPKWASGLGTGQGLGMGAGGGAGQGQGKNRGACFW